MSILYVGIGFMMLIAGRPVYLVFVGSIAFLVGTYLTDQIAIVPPTWNEFFLPLLFAAIGIALTQAFRRWLAGLAGFIAGGIMITNLPIALGSQEYWSSPYVFLIAGAIALIMLIFWFDFALVVVSSLMAVTLILSTMKLGNLDQGAMFLILTIFGIITQHLILEYGKPSPD